MPSYEEISASFE